jgi:hypothetical protein
MRVFIPLPDELGKHRESNIQTHSGDSDGADVVRNEFQIGFGDLSWSSPACAASSLQRARHVNVICIEPWGLCRVIPDRIRLSCIAYKVG